MIMIMIIMTVYSENASVYNLAMSESTNILFRDFVCMMAVYLIVFISVENKNKLIISLEVKVILHYRTPWLRQAMVANESEKTLKNISLT